VCLSTAFPAGEFAREAAVLDFQLEFVGFVDGFDVVFARVVVESECGALYVVDGDSCPLFGCVHGVSVAGGVADDVPFGSVDGLGVFVGIFDVLLVECVFNGFAATAAFQEAVIVFDLFDVLFDS